jgi:hypothetical protein
MSTAQDAATLERAAEILRERTTRPGSFWLRVWCYVLTGTARKIRAELAARRL